MLHRPGLDQGQGGLSVGLGTAQEDEIVTVADDHIACVGHDRSNGCKYRLDSNGLSTDPCGTPASGVHWGIPSRISWSRKRWSRARSVPSLTFLPRVPRGGLWESSRSTFPRRHRPPRCSPPSATDRLPAGRLYSLVPVGSHSYTGESPVQRSAQGPASRPPVQSGLSPQRCPRAGWSLAFGNVDPPGRQGLVPARTQVPLELC